ncbi:protein vestigial isoform X4 [Vespula squamosa]|uniref:Protein vestigial isoform X4 n=1 Tax=Vespula squamosa TaxID=30214 RepID=A0ABD2AUE7_VESSQ
MGCTISSEHYVLFGLIASGRDDAGTHSIALALFAVQARRLNVHQRSLEAAGLELCGGGGSVPQGQPSSAGSVGSAPSPASPRPTPQPRPPLATTTSQPSRTLDDDRSTDGAATAAEDSDDGESRAQYVSANCVVFTHYRGDAASEVEEHFQRALAHDKPKGKINWILYSNTNKCSSKMNQSTKEKSFGIHEKEAANVQSRLASTTASSFGRKREALARNNRTVVVGTRRLKTWLCGNAGVGGSKSEKIVEHRGGDRGIVVEAEEEEEKRKRGKRIRRSWRWENISPMSMRNFPPSFWNSQHPSDVYEYPADPWHAHYAPYQHRAVHEYHQHNMAAAASYSGLLLGSARGHHTSHHAAHHAAHHVHAAASYKDWTSATPSQSLVDVSSAPPYPHGPYASLSVLVKNDVSISLTFKRCGQTSVYVVEYSVSSRKCRIPKISTGSRSERRSLANRTDEPRDFP